MPLRFDRRWPLAAAALICLLTAACSSDAERMLHPDPRDPATTGLEWSPAAAQPGGRIAVAVTAEAEPGVALAGIQGWLRFDPGHLRYLGQLAELPTITLINDTRAVAGTLRIASLNPAGLSRRTVTLVFEATTRDAGRGLRYQPEIAVTTDLRPVMSIGSAAGPVVAPDLTVPGSPRRLTLADWNALLAPGEAGPGPELNVPGQIVPGLRYGDVNLNGTLNITDAASAANVAVGNFPLLTDAGKDYVIAGDVAPANLPGLGEVGDPVPPGRESGGGHVINIVDAAVIANDVVGTDFPVAGELIPGREPLPADRVVISGNLAADRTLYRDTIYELQGQVNVPGSVTLTIEAGTRIEGDAATRGALVIRRGGNLVAAGTRLQPIVFACNSATPAPGCWGGVTIDGFSLLNNGTTETVCPEKGGQVGGTGLYGGCLVDDDSGVLRYVRIEYAGAPLPVLGPGATPGLQLLGVGRGTVVDSTQVHGSLGDGLFVSGGTVDFRSVVLTANAGVGFRWDDGWVGRSQFLMVQQHTGSAGGLRGSNYAGDPDAGPRSNPQIYHVTVQLPDAVPGLVLENGTAGALRNLILLGAGGVGLDIQGQWSCDQAAGMMPGLHVDHSIFFGGGPDFSADVDCLDEAAYATAPARANRVVDPQLIAAGNTLTPDLRPVSGSAPTSGFVLPPSDGFFDLTAQMVGAVAGANTNGSNIPWYAGWSRGWSGVP